MAQLSLPTWRFLGLGVAAGYAGLGLFQAILPIRAASEIYDIPKHATSPPDDTNEQIATLMGLIAARDLSVATMLFSFAYAGKTKEMGTVILGGTILCIADSVAVWKRKGPAA
jgi:hypothetical protein